MLAAKIVFVYLGETQQLAFRSCSPCANWLKFLKGQFGRPGVNIKCGIKHYPYGISEHKTMIKPNVPPKTMRISKQTIFCQSGAIMQNLLKYVC